MFEPTLLQTRDAIRSGRMSSRQAVELALAAIEKTDPTLRAFLSYDPERALRQADAIDARLARGEPCGALAGVPVAIKDNMCTRFGVTSCASKILANFRSPYDAHVVERLNAADAIILGKTNLDEFAMGSSTENSALAITRNPWHTDCVPGGSSGGSAVAVAARMVPGALGSDTGGSIRLPAALCGVVGFKPTYGRVSRYGLVAYGSSLDQIGPFARDIPDVALLMNVIAGHDPRDSTSVDAPVPDYLAALQEPLGPVKIGVAKEFFVEGLDPEVAEAVRQALREYERAGAQIVELSLPTAPYWLAAYTIVAFAEASSNLARYDGVHYGHRTAQPKDFIDMYSASRREGFGAEVKRRIMLGTYTLSSGYYEAYYLKALKARTLIQRDFQAALEKVDVLAGPVSPTPAFRIGEKIADPLTMYLTDIYTVGVNLAGIPGISIPCGFARSGLPIGLQLLGRPFGEDRLLRIAHEYQLRTDWHTKAPPL